MPTTAEEYRAKARECEQRAEKERDPSFKRQLLEEARRWLALAELCGELSAVAASVGGLFSNSIIISTGLSQFEFLQPIPIRDLRIPAHRGTHV
jgi:hypothetical protein